MADETSIVAKPRDYSEIAKFDLTRLQNPTELDAFLENPATFIAETLTGALAVGKTGAAVAGGRIVQGILKGRAFKQFGAEFRKLRDAGKIPEDFAEKRYGFQTWVELMTIIDEDSPDEDRLEALKAMFYNVNKTTASDGERIAAYHLWQITRGLSSGELIVLKTMAEAKAGLQPQQQILDFVAAQIGHGISGLVSMHYEKLVSLNLVYRDSGMASPNPPVNRLTPLGKRVCQSIESYKISLRGDDLV
jgi:hypothetical protein